MAKSILQERAACQCYACLHLEGDASIKRGLEEHHVLHGAYKSLAEKHGLKVMLCKRHHTGDISGNAQAVHHNKELDDWLRKRAQIVWMERWKSQTGGDNEAAQEAWIKTFGKSWI